MSSGVTAMEHVLVLADDIDQAREFYCDVVGLRARRTSGARVPGLLAVRRRNTLFAPGGSVSPILEHARRAGLPVAGGAWTPDPLTT